MSIPSFVLVQGAINGLGYGLLAMGLVLIYRTNRVLNFAQGQLGVVAAVFMVKCFYDFGFNYWFALVLSLVLAAAVGALSELLLRRHDIYIQPINYPTVAKGTERLRITPTPRHNEAQVATLVEALVDVWKTLDLPFEEPRVIPFRRSDAQPAECSYPEIKKAAE